MSTPLNRRRPPSAWRQAILHSAYYAAGIAAARQRGVDLPLSAAGQGRMHSLLDVVPWMDALDVVGRPEVGWEIGQAITVASHGAVGYLTVSSATVGEAMHHIARYIGNRNRLFRYRCDDAPDGVVLSITPALNLGPYRGFLEMATAVSLFSVVSGLIDARGHQGLHMSGAWSASKSLSPPRGWQFGQAVTALHVPLATAQLPLATADPRLCALAQRSCEEELEAARGSISARVRALMPQENDAWPSMTEIAQQLAMTPRTLARKLASEDLSFQQLRDDMRCETACWYLTHSTLSTLAIAERIGLSDDTNFSRLFRRWRGTTPHQYRQASRSQ